MLIQLDDHLEDCLVCGVELYCIILQVYIKDLQF